MLLRIFRTGGGVSALGPLETEIMNCVWDSSHPVTVADVHQSIGRRGRRIAYSTVKAVLTNLSEKGHLKKRSHGRSNFFSARESREEFKDRIVRHVLSSLAEEHRAPLVAYLVNEVAKDEAGVRELERLIRAKRRGRTGRP